VDVGDLPNHVKYCVSVLTLRLATINTPPVRAWGSRNPLTIGIRAHGLKGCLILLKNESCQNYVLTTSLCRGERDEATVENRVEIGRRKRPHAPTRLLPTRTDARHASHASSSPGWADPTRIPDDPTHVPDPDKDDVIMMPT
jgi:hypothetical protein